jgi:DMSO/TMAO reductase YedYZ molybdopterin-dependent catalytic subunit
VDKYGQPLFYPNSKEYLGQSQAPSGDVVLTITGAVEKELKLKMSDLRNMEVISETVEHPKKGMTPYEGVRLNALLSQAKPKSDATKIILTASDGFTAEVALADVTKCADCLIAFGDGGKLHAAMPGMQSNTWVKDIIKIEVK